MKRLKVFLADVSITKMGLLSSATAFLANGAVALAQTQTAIPSPISSKDGIIHFLCIIVGFFFYLIISLSVLMILWAAFTYVTAGDDAEKTSKARRIITYAAIGVFVAIIANGFPALIDSFFTGGGSMNFSNAAC